MRSKFIKYLPIFLAILLYVLIYFLRLQQQIPDTGNLGFDNKTGNNLDILKPQREALDKTIASFLPSPQAELLSGILLGESKNLPGKLRLALRDTSTLHIAVASGQNLTIVSAFFLSLAPLIKRKNALLLSLGAAIFYTILSGLQAPILRACIMFSLASIAQFFGRQRSGVWVLLVTGGIMLLINPNWLTSLSFQLSFLATLGVIVVSPILLIYFKKVPIIGQDLAVTLAAQILVTPVIAQNFHQISLVSLITNVLILWTISFIMIIGAIMIFFGVISVVLGSLVALIVNALLTYLIYIVQFFSSLPFAWEYVGEQVVWVWVGYYILVLGLILGLHNLESRIQNSEL